MERAEIPGVGAAQSVDRAVAVLAILVRGGEAGLTKVAPGRGGGITEVAPGRVIAPALGCD